MPRIFDSKNTVLKFISEKGSVKEIELLHFINENQAEFFKSLGSNPSLYKKHFLLFNHLYRLNEELSQDGFRLIISALEIKLCPITDLGTEIAHTDALKTFYLDKKHLELSDQALDEMMNDFWKKYLALDKKSEALKVMGLVSEPDLTLSKLNKRYNQLAKLHHPDKGGDKNQFIELKIAYGDLKVLFH